jgi:Tfp pilus assembly protein PilF
VGGAISRGSDVSAETPRAAKPKPPSAADLKAAKDIYKRGNSSLFAGDAPGAAAAFREALRLDPSHTPSMRGLGLAYTQVGNRTLAIDAFQRYLKAAPKAPDAAMIKKRLEDLKSGR